MPLALDEFSRRDLGLGTDPPRMTTGSYRAVLGRLAHVLKMVHQDGKRGSGHHA